MRGTSNFPLGRVLFCTCFSIALLTNQIAFAQTVNTGTAPLSVIDWLGKQTTPVDQSKPQTSRSIEPAVTKNGLPPEISVAPLGSGSPRQIGLVPANVTGLPSTLWQGSDVAKIISLLDHLPDLTVPAAQSLLYTILLAEADAPGGISSAGDALALARVEKLMTLGALDPALSLIEQAGVPTSPAHFDLWMKISLLTGVEDRACAVLRTSAHLTSDLGTRILCASRAGQWDNAALTFGSAQALDLIPKEKLAVIDRFLHPDAFEGSAPLPVPRDIDPLSFRLFEAIGEPLPTHVLPRAYAVADLRDLVGWKSQIEAAERLTRAGALPDNQLLGLYTERKAAASGGVWDRVAAVQQFETALATGSSDAITKTLPRAWRTMQDAGLEIAFVGLFAADLDKVDVAGSARSIATTVSLLSVNYEQAAVRTGTPTLTSQIALGELTGPRPADAMSAALYDAFTDAEPRADLVAAARQSRLGESILHILALLEDGANGDANALRSAIATLRTLGLEDIARRTALQILLLDR